MNSQLVILSSQTSLVELLKKGKIAVIPTDTVYGIVGSALNPKTVEKIYKLRKRTSRKPFIILISKLSDLEKFDIRLTEKQKEFLQKNWPNPLSTVLPCKNEKFKYLHRGKNSLAFRIPKNDWLQKLLKEVGPLVAPSANFEGESPFQTINEAKKYFGDQVAFYVDAGKVESVVSTLIKLNYDGTYTILREGMVKFKVDANSWTNFKTGKGSKILLTGGD